MTKEMFIVEYEDGEIDDSQDMGGFTVFLDRPSANEALEYLEDDEQASVVRFVRESELKEYAAKSLEKLGNDFGDGPNGKLLKQECFNRAAIIRSQGL